MRSWLIVPVLVFAVAACPQNSGSANSSAANSQNQDSASSQTTRPNTPNLAPPRSDSVNAAALGDGPGESSSKDTIIDLSPPDEDLKAHPGESKGSADTAGPPNDGDVSEFHPWDPHKAAKDVEVGDFYFRKKNYAAAESRYREALTYKDNDAVARFRLAACLEKMSRLYEAREEYENYLKILPDGPEAEHARKALKRLPSVASPAK